MAGPAQTLLGRAGLPGAHAWAALQGGKAGGIQRFLHVARVLAHRAGDTLSSACGHPGASGPAERGGITPLPPASGREAETKLGHCFSLFQIRKSFVTVGRGGCRGWGRGGGLLSGKCQSVHTTWRTNVCFITRPTEPAEHLQQACAPAPPPREKVTVMDLPILINVNKQKRNIK